jgi:SAM-dependent methyltransferase
VRSVREALSLLEPADVLVCQQAVNYWMSAELAKMVAQAVKPEGRFVFNTFNKKPSHEPTLKEYTLDGRAYAEVSWLRVDDAGREVVEHVQACEGMAPHTTRFAWIDREAFARWLSPYFSCVEDVDHATSVWTCFRKK